MSVVQNDELSDSAITLLARRAVARYPDRLQGDLTLQCRSENATFRLIANGRAYALRLHRGSYHEKADIESELLWLDALREDTGITVPEAIADRHGERVLSVSNENGDRRHAVLFHWIGGEAPTTTIDPGSFRRLGEITAKLHRHSRHWQRPASFRRILWDHRSMVGPNGHWGHWRDVPGLSASGAQLLTQAVGQIDGVLAVYGQGPQHFGLIHADLRLANILLHEGDARVIDFDDCGMGWYLHDLAAAVSFEEHHPSAPLWVENWLQGYERVAHTEDSSLAVLPSMLMQRRIQLTAWMASHAQTETAMGLRHRWVEDTVRLCERYLDGKGLPLGA